MLSVLLSASALVAAGSLAYAQAKPAKPLPSFPKPPVLKVPAGVTLSSISVKAACGQASRVTVKVSYSKVLLADKVYLWGSLGQATVEIPAGTGVKVVDFVGPVLACDGQAPNFGEVMQPAVFMGETYVIYPESFESGSSVAYRQQS